MVSDWRLLWKPRWLRNAMHPLWPCSDPFSFPRLVYHPHMGRISISRKEGEVLLSRQLRFSQCKRDPISSSNLTSDSICQQSAPPPDTRRLRSSRGCQLCSQMLPFAGPVFVKAVLFFFCCWMTSVISRAFWPWVAEQSGAAGPPWQPGGLEATERSVAWCSWQTGLPSGPRHPGRPSLPSKFKCAPSHKCIMGTRIPRLHTYQALSLRLWAPEHTGNCGHPVGTSCFQFVGRTRVDLLHFYCFFFVFFLLLPKTVTVSS